MLCVCGTDDPPPSEPSDMVFGYLFHIPCRINSLHIPVLWKIVGSNPTGDPNRCFCRLAQLEIVSLFIHFNLYPFNIKQTFGNGLCSFIPLPLVE